MWCYYQNGVDVGGCCGYCVVFSVIVLGIVECLIELDNVVVVFFVICWVFVEEVDDIVGLGGQQQVGGGKQYFIWFVYWDNLFVVQWGRELFEMDIDQLIVVCVVFDCFVQCVVVVVYKG